LLDEPNVAAGLECARKLAGSSGVIVITGSIYIVGEVLEQLSSKPAQQGAKHG
jgi:folylpolyglutamate synthase/dihydropteroate synthase